ncbi:MAG: WGxxGxxG-CTERM domain-containing protein [Candidatus Eremiobacteraeota bacterium]|nr:WGxxGxxG-CTERM domain-containing protein [Candidatus Eremiobacteraeota bacterium]MBC5828409.1 WGxxGxxG-CTERM domain-containing protein [Candidatus Eremiobacteraeota bacterium]
MKKHLTRALSVVALSAGLLIMPLASMSLAQPATTAPGMTTATAAPDATTTTTDTTTTDHPDYGWVGLLGLLGLLGMRRPTTVTRDVDYRTTTPPVSR